MYPRLTAMAHSLLVDTGFKYRSIFNTNMSQSGTYLEEAVYKCDTKYAINVDEDAFVFNVDAMLDLVSYMDKHDFGFCGVPDGGVIHHREHNPIAPNPFFNIFNCDLLKNFPPIVVPKEDDDKLKGIFDPQLIVHEPTTLFKDGVDWKYDNFQWQYYHLFFNWLLRGIKPLYLDIDIGDDGISTIVKNHKGVPFLEHTWFARHYYDGFIDGVNHFNRINSIYESYVDDRKYDIGIVVPCDGVDNRIKQDFILRVENLNIDLKYRIQFVDDGIYTDGYFNPSKSRNHGIKSLLKTCDVIVCCDIDMAIPNGLLEFTCRKCKQTNGFVFSYSRFMNLDDWQHSSIKQILNVGAASSGVGGWIAMCSVDWIKIGGWNEDLYGWGYEDQELHNRVQNLNIPRMFTNSFPLVHINHPVRQTNHIETQRQNIQIANSSMNTNWLED